MMRLNTTISRIIPPAFWAWILLVAIPIASAETFIFNHENVLGTSLELQLSADSEAIAQGAETRVLAEIDRLAAIFSGYDAASEFSRWQADRLDTPVKLSPELFSLLEASDHWRTVSAGVFDPRVEILSRLWSRTARQGREPTEKELAEARAVLARPAWRLTAGSSTARRLTDCPVTLNAIAKGDIVERACRAGLEIDGRPVREIHGLLLNIGGDLRACGETPATIGLAPAQGDSEATEPTVWIEVRDRAVATSGSAQRGFDIQGRHYSHILDPSIGRPVERIVSATVIADRSADADALATIFNVLPIEEGLKLADATPGVACLLTSTDGRMLPSQRWPAYETRNPIEIAAAAPFEVKPAAEGTAPAWNDTHELVVKFELNGQAQQAGGMFRRYRRPYVAVWVEDRAEHPVRTLVLWFQTGGKGTRWLPDLKRWYRGNQSNARDASGRTNLVATVARPTRPPGKYEAIWDGKDNKGRSLPAGTYTVWIEAAREHGTYQIIHKTITIADRPFAEELTGNVEISSASLAYRSRARARVQAQPQPQPRNAEQQPTEPVLAPR